jgi:Zn-dependent protease
MQTSLDTPVSLPHAKAKQSKSGIVALLSKAAAKSAPFLLKLLKLFKVGKLTLIGLSFASYAYMFTWKFSIVILGSLFVHESGHIWAMKRFGMKTKGIYFIPFIGGAAVSGDRFSSHFSEAHIALCGPLWGCALAALMLGVGAYLGSPLLAAAAGWIALCNLFNLAPINPLDGGRVVKSVSFSINRFLGLGVMCFGLAAAAALSFFAPIFLFVVLMGAVELLLFHWNLDWLTSERARKEIEAQRARPLMRGSQIALLLVGYLVLAAILVAVMVTAKSLPGADASWKTLRGL